MHVIHMPRHMWAIQTIDTAHPSCSSRLINMKSAKCMQPEIYLLFLSGMRKIPRFVKFDMHGEGSISAEMKQCLVPVPLVSLAET
jgi:hypothetical protein